MDPQTELHPVTCARCGADRPPELTQGAPRTPCPECGGTSINVHITLTAEVTTTATLARTLHPADQARDWKRRWLEIERELAALLEAQSGGMSGEAIHAARHRLHSFYIQAYHLKDALKEETSSTRIAPATVEAAISAEPALALLADLANLDKHGNLSRAPRSGDIPRIVSASATSDDAVSKGWRLHLGIQHGGHVLDGFTVATEAVEAWRRVLSGWGLL